MLKPAQLFIDQLERKTWEIAYDKKYMYATLGYTESYLPSKDNWNSHDFVSVINDKVLGHISYSINRQSKVAYGFYAVNYSDSLIFAIDLLKAIDDIFTKYDFQKIQFRVIIGNPIEKTYDKLINIYGGRIVGILKREVCLMDNKLYDAKIYELLQEEYISNRIKKKKQQRKRLSLQAAIERNGICRT